MTSRNIVMAWLWTMLLALSGSSAGADVTITDDAGKTKQVSGVMLDYTPTLGGYVDAERGGLRVFEESGKTLVNWSNVKRLSITGLDKSNKNDWHVTGELTLADGKSVKVKLGQPRLLGETDLGSFKTEIAKLKSIEPVPNQSK